jgi:hypothetical protein
LAWAWRILDPLSWKKRVKKEDCWCRELLVAQVASFQNNNYGSSSNDHATICGYVCTPMMGDWRFEGFIQTNERQETKMMMWLAP